MVGVERDDAAVLHHAAEVDTIRTGETKINDERFVQSLAPIAGTYAKGYWNEDFASKQFADIEAAFGAGEIGITPGLITGAINWRVFDDSLGKDNYGVFTAPLVDGGVERKQFFNPVLLYGLSINTEQADLARDWISYVVSKEGQETMLEPAGSSRTGPTSTSRRWPRAPAPRPSRPSSTRSAASRRRR